MAAQSTMPEDAWWLGTDSGAVAEDSGSDTTSINAHKVPDGNIGTRPRRQRSEAEVYLNMTPATNGLLCPLCYVEFLSSNALLRHVQAVHPQHVPTGNETLAEKYTGVLTPTAVASGESDYSTGLLCAGGGWVNPTMSPVTITPPHTAFGLPLRSSAPQGIGVRRDLKTMFQYVRCRGKERYRLLWEANQTAWKVSILERLFFPTPTELPKDKRNSMHAFRLYEKSLVMWEPNRNHTLCPVCMEVRFDTLFAERRHHCRLCGTVLCNACSEHVDAKMAIELIVASRPCEAVAFGGRDAQGISPPTYDRCSHDGTFFVNYSSPRKASSTTSGSNTRSPGADNTEYTEGTAITCSSCPCADQLDKPVWVNGFGMGRLKYYGPLHANADLQPSASDVTFSANPRDHASTADDTLTPSPAEQIDPNLDGSALQRSQMWCGVELSQNVGISDGSLMGVRYFHTTPGKALFIPATSKHVRVLKDRELTPAVPSVRVCRSCYHDIDAMCAKILHDKAFTTQRTLDATRAPPEVFSVYRKLRDIAHFLDEELGVYLANASLIVRLECLENYDTTKTLAIKINAAVRQLVVLHDEVMVLTHARAMLGNGTVVSTPTNETDGNGVFPRTKEHSSASATPVGHTLVSSSVLLPRRSRICVYSKIAGNIAESIRGRLHNIPKELLRLPSETEVAQEQERRKHAAAKLLGYKPSKTVRVWEHERRVPIIGFAKLLLPHDPSAYVKEGHDDADAVVLRSLTQKLLTGVISRAEHDHILTMHTEGRSEDTEEGVSVSNVNSANNDNANSAYARRGRQPSNVLDVSPQPGHVWAPQSAWHVCNEDPNANPDNTAKGPGTAILGDGWMYATGFAAVTWRPVFDPYVHFVRRRAWEREQIAVEGHTGWVDDADARICMVCQKSEFTFLNRRHHCRHCGRVACADCTRYRSWHKDYKEPVRTCVSCMAKGSASPIDLMGDDEDMSPYDYSIVVRAWEENPIASNQPMDDANKLTFLPQETSSWVQEGGDRRFRFRQDFEETLPRHAKWVSKQWFVDESIGDARGWQYARSADGGTWVNERFDKATVRRRRWLRRLSVMRKDPNTRT